MFFQIGVFSKILAKITTPVFFAVYINAIDFNKSM